MVTKRSHILKQTCSWMLSAGRHTTLLKDEPIVSAFQWIFRNPSEQLFTEVATRGFKKK